VALAAYGQRARAPVRVFAPQDTPPTILAQIRSLGAGLELLDGHIGDCGKAARAFAEAHGAMDVSTLREPYRIEGKKTLGIELAEQLGWTVPDCIIYPTGGGTGLIGMWKAFQELSGAGWIPQELPRMISVQSTGCAPVVRAFEAGATATDPWPDPHTVASGLQVPAPLGGKLMLQAIRESGGTAVAVEDSALVEGQRDLAVHEGIDACPEGEESVVLFNTGAGWLYR
jgi:threonine synthase